MEKVTEIAEKLKPILERHQVVLAYLFGSAARGEMGPHSDIDLGVVFDHPLSSEEGFKRRLRLSSDVTGALGVEDADVIDLQTAKDPLIKHNAVFTGVPILVKDVDHRFVIERQIVREYENTKPLRRIASLVLREQLRDNTFGRPLMRPKFGP